jgi:hypothetical protein
MKILVLQKFSYSLLSEGETSAGVTRGGTRNDITITDNLLCHKIQVELYTDSTPYGTIYTQSVTQQQQQAKAFCQKNHHTSCCKATM